MFEINWQSAVLGIRINNTGNSSIKFVQKSLKCFLVCSLESCLFTLSRGQHGKYPKIEKGSSRLEIFSLQISQA